MKTIHKVLIILTTILLLGVLTIGLIVWNNSSSSKVSTNPKPKISISTSTDNSKIALTTQIPKAQLLASSSQESSDVESSSNNQIKSETSTSSQEQAQSSVAESSSVTQKTTENINSTKVITAPEVATHSTKDDCWASLDSKVYNITPYVPMHPGGEAKIARYCGKSLDTVTNHPKGGLLGAVIQGILSAFYVGDLS